MNNTMDAQAQSLEAEDDVRRIAGLMMNGPKPLPYSVIERAARAFWIASCDDPHWAAMAWDEMGGSEPEYERAKIEVAMRAALEEVRRVARQEVYQ